MATSYLLSRSADLKPQHPNNHQSSRNGACSVLKTTGKLIAISFALSLTACGGGGGGGVGDSSTSTTSGNNSTASSSSASVEATSMTLTWNPVANADLGYLVYYGNGLIMDPAPVSTLLPKPKVTFNAQKDFGLSSGDYACFWVQAVNSAGMSDLSDPVCGLV